MTMALFSEDKTTAALLLMNAIEIGRKLQWHWLIIGASETWMRCELWVWMRMCSAFFIATVRSSSYMTLYLPH